MSLLTIYHSINPMKSILLITTLITIATPTITQATPLSSNTFKLPSNNIHCEVVPDRGSAPAQQAFLRCDVLSQLKPMPPKDKSCQLDWGKGLVLPKASKAEVLCAGDTIYGPNYPVLQYGKTWKKEGFTCQSSRKGLTCTNPKKQSFFLNRNEWRSF
jgi:hypothetical protein